MTSNGTITEALLSLRFGGRISDAWWTDEAIVMAINTIEGLQITSKQLNIAVTKDHDKLSDVDTIAGLNCCGIMRIKRKVNGVVGFFYFLKMNKQAKTPRKQDEWNQIVKKNLPRLSPRQITPATIPMVANRDMSNSGTKRKRAEPAETTAIEPRTIAFTPSTPLLDTGVWYDQKTRNLFGVEEQDDVRDGLQKVIDLLDDVLRKSDVSLVLTEPHKTLAEESIPEATLSYLYHKVKILRLAYTIALDKYDERFTWKQCCTQANKLLTLTGERTYAVDTIMKWNRRFRDNKKWPHPFASLRQYTPWFFRNNPCAVQIARAFLSKDLTQLSTEFATEYFRGKFLDDVLDFEYEDDLPVDHRETAKESLLSENKLKSISTATACRWLAYLGYKFQAHRRVYYTDEHEREDNKAARIEFVNTIKADEILKYKWVILTAAQKNELESLEKNPLAKDCHCRTYELETLFEYHVGKHPHLLEYVTTANRDLHGGDLSRERFKRPGFRPLLEVGQDEAIFQQNAQSAMEWQGPNGESTPRPKGDGEAIMVSAFIGPSIGFGRNTVVSEEQLKRINRIRARDRPTYHDKYAADEVHGHDKKRLFETEDDVQNALCVRFEHGKHREGYWNNAHMTIQTEDAIDIIQGLFPGHDIQLHYDQSSGHTKKRHFGLNTEVMIKSWGGSTPEMRDSRMTSNCLGPFDHAQKLKIGEIQCMKFKETDIGPWELSQDERLQQKYDCPTGEKKTETKRKKQLMRELNKTNRGTKIEQLKEEAIERGISLTYQVDEIKKGWCGASKGMLQVLYERGWIDPSKPASYYKAAIPKSWRDEDGNLKVENTERAKTTVLPVMLRDCEDFATEITAMEDLCNNLSTRSCNVTILFTPKYHCELAGCGIELAWGFQKRYYRRKISMREKKSDFKGCVDRCLSVVSKDHCFRFMNRVRRYAEAYRLFHLHGKNTTYDLI